MSRGRPLAASLAVVCLMAGSCAGLGRHQKTPSKPEPSTAIALSILDGAVYLVDPSSGERTEIVRGLTDFQSGFAAWSPDHTELAYGNHGIYVIDFPGNRHRELIAGDRLSMPTWSPSGQVLAYGDAASLWITPVDVVGPYRIRLPKTLAPIGMHWSDDGIAFEGIRRDCRSSPLCPSTDDTDIWFVQADGTDLHRITRIRQALAPRWSPDGTQILFIRRFGEDRRQLWVVKASGGNPRRIGTASDVLAADWSPDENRLAMVRTGTQAGTLQVWIADADGGNGHAIGLPLSGTAASIDW
jgi:Tol biopolymer transport system component